MTDTVTIPIEAIDGTARATSDYKSTDIPPSVTFEPGDTEVEVPIGIVRNLRYEGTETFSVGLGTPSFGTVADGSATITIDDTADIPVPRLVPGPVLVTAEDAGSVSLSLVVPRAPEVDVNFFVSTAGGLAVAGEDYVDFNQEIVIPAGRSTSPSFSIAIIDDADSSESAEENFAVVVSAFDDPSTVAGQTLVTIVENDRLPHARIVRPPGVGPRDAFTRSLVEGTLQPVTSIVTVMLDDASVFEPYEVEVSLAALDADDVDRLNADVSIEPVEPDGSTVLTFAPGVTEQSFRVTIAANTIPDDDISFGVVVTNTERFGLIGSPDDQVTVNILDDDADPPPTVGDDLRTGLGDLFAGTASTPGGATPAFDLGIGSGFDLGDVDWGALGLPAIDPPVIPTDLGALFDLRDVLAVVPAPIVDTTSVALADLVADLTAVGCPVDFAVGGAGGAPAAPAPSDIIQVRCTRTLGELLEASGYSGDDLNGATPDILEGLCEPEPRR